MKRASWAAVTETGIARAVTEQSAPSLHHSCPEAAGDLAKLVAQLLAKFATGRPSTAQSVAETLAALAGHYGSSDPQPELTRAVF